MDTKSFHLEGQPAPEGLLKGVTSKGEFHEIPESASQVLLRGGAPTGEIHLETQCASEGLLTGVAREGEFHEATCRDFAHQTLDSQRSFLHQGLYDKSSKFTPIMIV